MATKTLRVFAEYTSTGFVPMPTAGNIDYGYTLGSTFPATTPTTFQTDNPDLVVTVTAMTDFYVWIRINGQAWNPSYTRNVRVYPDSPNINNVVMNMIIATGPAGVSSYTQIVQTSNRLYFNGATTDSIYNSKFAGKTYINELNFGTAPGLATVATSGAYADLTGKPTLATVATSGLFTDLSSKPSGTAPLSYNSGTNSFVITQANTSTNGYLSSTDWNTFNNKFTTPAGTTLQYVDGTGALQTFPVLASADKLVINVRNSSGVSMPKGSVVYINGATGNKPTVALSQGNSNATSAQTLGLLQTTLANNAEGNVVIVGAVTDLNTSAFSEGQQLYLSPTTAGAYTATKQYAPNHLVYVGVVIRSHVSLGTIEVKVQNGYEMDELHNVSAQSPSNNDGLFYNTTTSLWEKKSIATVLGYTPYNGTDTSIKALFSATTPLSYSNGVYSISQATTSSNGYLSSTDWNTFNSKGSALNGTGFVKATGTTISYDNTSYLPLSGGLMTGSIQFSDTTNLKRGIYGSMGTDDNWFVGANAGGVSQGYLEIATGDDGTEPIYATQYNGNAFTTGTVARRVTLLDGSGNSIFPNTLTATTLVKSGGTSSQFLKADGSVDSSTYLTTASAASTYQTILTNPVTGTGTTNTIAYWSSSSAIGALALATYPSLTELAYVKGVTSAIQTQLNAKAATLSGTTGYYAKFTSSSTIGNSVIYDNGTNASIGNTNPFAGVTTLTGMAISDRGGIYKLAVNDVIYVSNNLYYDGSVWKRITANGGTTMQVESVDGGSFAIYGAATGTAASTATLNERFRITADGNFGLGLSPFTNTLSKGFDLIGGGGMFSIGNSFYINSNSYYNTEWRYKATGGACGVNMNSDGSISFANAASGTINTNIPFSQKMVIQTNGQVKIGTTGNFYADSLVVYAGIGNGEGGITIAAASNTSRNFLAFADGTGGEDRYRGLLGYNHTDDSMLFYTNANERMRVTSDGLLIVGNTSGNGSRIYVQGSLYATGNITANSDLTLKKNLKLIDNSINKLMQLNGYSYQWKSDDSHQYGVIAQEVEKILPYAVTTGNDGIKGVSYNQLTPLLIEGFKSHESEITILKARVKYLESKLA
jgi:hypothetical protein